MRPVARRACICLLVMLAGLATGCDGDTQSLVSVPTVQEANEIVVALEAAGVHATIDETTAQRKSAFAIRIAVASEAAARRVLVEKSLPREPAPGYEQLAGQSSLILSAADQQQRLLIALSGELSRTLEAVDGVIQARVHIASPPQSGAMGQLTKAPPPPTATVLLRTNRPIESLAITAATTQPSDASTPQAKIQQLVAQSVPGLTADHVSVMTSVVPPANATTAMTQIGDERNAAVAQAQRLKGIVIALAIVSVLSIAAVVLQAVRSRRA